MRTHKKNFNLIQRIKLGVYSHIHSQNTTTSFGPASGPSSGWLQNHQGDYTTGVWGGRDLVLHES